VRVAVVGATGLIGRAVCAALGGRGDEALALSRGGGSVEGAARAVAWDPADAPLPAEAREGVDAVVNLAGAPLTERWTEARKRAIRESRLTTTERVADACADGGPRVLVNASGVDYYGDHGEEMIDERTPAGTGFLPELCVEWEAAAAAAAEARGARVVRIRTGLVLSPDGGTLPRLVTPTKLGAGGPLGSGRQWWPWIHIADEVGIILWALDTPAASGPVNASAPNPARQRHVAKVLGRVLGRPAVVPAPAPALRLVLGEVADLALASHRVLPAAAAAGGYRFRFPDLEAALRDALGR
jgi:uncharacterized protein (TIGR01777 family)